MIKIKQKGDFSKTSRYFERAKKPLNINTFHKYGRKGVEALRAATPVDTGLTANSWYYEIINDNGIIKLTFNNSNIYRGIQIAVIIQYGHATRNGGWIEGRDYINPAIQPIFDEIANDAWKEVSML